ncbi:peroxide stress protein YaaA [Ottowia sp.]|jgi:cytoplasmic iron level regulating protein YaaA (DUF328/UPF0246 family)|uniref:peroxide stress protein YaaA n=1 Tax=Ottowia sp. TaxID=1898956 RepID=UPI0025D54EE6|nr:peroxide stress protein YaaA [Ottowia sp.]MBK6615789.1 peroxide stress protein YaaA [Ottowia sp.]MBK6746836.1 peroxide stress protein YaaA [Ottowia sp.]
MLFVLSPAKALDYDTPVPTDLPHTLPVFGPRAAELVGVLREKSPEQVAGLMRLSDALAGLNVARYAAWRPRHTARNARQAVLAFDGDVYGGLQARTLKPAQLQWLQQHLCILSGLYGVLRPLDRMQPYRLEMGTALKTAGGANLYQFWGPRIADYLNQRLAQQRAPVLINLASQEYFKSVDRKVLKGRVIDCVFEDYKGGYKVISFFAKRARGLMMRWAALHQAGTPARLQGFDLDGYAFAPAASAPDRLVFRRKTSGAVA